MLKIVHYFKSCYEVSTSKRVEYVEGSLESLLFKSRRCCISRWYEDDFNPPFTHFNTPVNALFNR